MSKVFLTGSTGFIGSAIVLRDQFKDAKIISRSPSKVLSDQRVFDLETFTDYGDMLVGVDVVIHVAGRAHIMKSGNNDNIKKNKLRQCES